VVLFFRVIFSFLVETVPGHETPPLDHLQISSFPHCEGIGTPPPGRQWPSPPELICRRMQLLSFKLFLSPRDPPFGPLSTNTSSLSPRHFVPKPNPFSFGLGPAHIRFLFSPLNPFLVADVGGFLPCSPSTVNVPPRDGKLPSGFFFS